LFLNIQFLILPASLPTCLLACVPVSIGLVIWTEFLSAVTEVCNNNHWL
jgi:hypothetical protein